MLEVGADRKAAREPGHGRAATQALGDVMRSRLAGRGVGLGDGAVRARDALVLDTAGQKGTGKWTAQSALDLGVPIPTLSLAVEARILSGLKAERVEASKIFRAPKAAFTGKREALISSLFSALYLGKVACYAQGLALIEAASKEYNYGVNLSEVARIWKAGRRRRCSAGRTSRPTRRVMSPAPAPRR